MHISRRLSLLALASLAMLGCSSSSPISTSSTGGGGGAAGHDAGGTTTSTSTGGHGGAGTGGAPADAGTQALRVLFVGNSYTYVNDLPSWVKKVADAAGGVTLTVDSKTVGAATLADQVSTTGAVDRIREGGWTHVVIQGQSQEPLIIPASFEMNAATLVEEAKMVGATPVFYETWAKKEGHADYQQAWTGGTPATYQARLRAEYEKVAMAGGALLAPGGDAWEKALAQQPGIELFQPDGSHPTPAGTYLVACVFFARLTGLPPVENTEHPTSISDAQAASLQALAAETVGVP